MIEKLHRIATAIQMLRLPSIYVALISLVSIAGSILISESHEGDRFMIPSVVGLLWAMSTYAFIVTFRSVPDKAGKASGLFSRLKHNIHRGWYWFIGVVFIGATLAVLLATYRMVSIWVIAYGG